MEHVTDKPRRCICASARGLLLPIPFIFILTSLRVLAPRFIKLSIKSQESDRHANASSKPTRQRHLDSCLSEKIVHLRTSETFCRRRSPSSFDSKLSSSRGRVPEAYNSIPATLWSRLRSMGEFMNQKDFLTIFCCCYERSLNKVVKCCLFRSLVLACRCISYHHL